MLAEFTFIFPDGLFLEQLWQAGNWLREIKKPAVP